MSLAKLSMDMDLLAQPLPTEFIRQTYCDQDVPINAHPARVSPATFYKLKAKYGGMHVSDAQGLGGA